jgi:hypothetical protein
LKVDIVWMGDGVGAATGFTTAGVGPGLKGADFFIWAQAGACDISRDGTMSEAASMRGTEIPLERQSGIRGSIV